MNKELLHKLFSYDEDTGVFKRIGRIRCNGKIVPCDFVGKATSSHGYLQYTIQSKTYDVHRLIFMYKEGIFPDCDIDHIDGNRQNNKWSNLRKVSRAENMRNLGRKNKPRSGVTGVGKSSTPNTWSVWIGKFFFKTGFSSFEEAVAYRKSKEKELGYTDSHFSREVWG